MRVLLDWRLRRDLAGHQVESVPLIGWAGIENGDLLRKAVDGGFEVSVTMASRKLRGMQLQSSRFERLRID